MAADNTPSPPSDIAQEIAAPLLGNQPDGNGVASMGLTALRSKSRSRFNFVSMTPSSVRTEGQTEWQKLWSSYADNPAKLRTLGISIRTAAGCVLASIIVLVPPLYRQFPEQVQGMLCTATVMVTFGVGDTVGQTVGWCFSGALGILVAFGNYWAMYFVTSYITSVTVHQCVVVAEFFLFTMLVNASGASYMARQMAMGYYCFYGLCLINPGCDLSQAKAADLWTLVGVAVSVLVMLVPPSRTAVSRTYAGRNCTLWRITRSTAQVTTLTMAVYLAVEEESLDTSKKCCATASRLAQASGHLAESVHVLQGSLASLGQRLQELETDISAFWWEGAVMEIDVVRRFLRTMRTTEGYLLMQRQAVLFSHGSDGAGDANFLDAVRVGLSAVSVKVVRLMGLVCKLLQCLHSMQPRLLPRRRSADGDFSASSAEGLVREAREIARYLTGQQAQMRLTLAQRNLTELPDLGEGRVLFILSVLRQSAEVIEFATWLCDKIDAELAEAKQDKEAFPRRRSQRRHYLQIAMDVAHHSVKKVQRSLDPRGKDWVYALKAAMALTASFMASAWWFDYDTMSVSATAYVLGAHGQDARCLGGTVWKALGRIFGVMFGGVLPAHIHNYFVPASGRAEDCPIAGHIVNGVGNTIWCFIGLHIYKQNRMATTKFGQFGYVALVAGFVGAEQFLSGCQNTVPVSNFILQTIGGTVWLLIIECTIRPKPACSFIQQQMQNMIDRQKLLLQEANNLLRTDTLTDLRMVSDNRLNMGESGYLTLHAGQRWAAEIQWLHSTVGGATSGLDQAMTEDTFKIGHIFYAFMPKGYSKEPYKLELYTEVVSLLKQMHLNVIFLLFAEEVDDLLRCRRRTLSMSNDASKGRTPWRLALKQDMSQMVALMTDALTDLSSLLEHSLSHDWRAGDLSISAAAVFMLEQANSAESPSNGLGDRGMRNIFASILAGVDPGLSGEDLQRHWDAFEAVLRSWHGKSDKLATPAHFQESLAGLLESLSGRPSLSLERLDMFLWYPDQILGHKDATVQPVGKDLERLCGSSDPHDEKVQQTALYICYEMALLDTVLVLAFTARKLCESLGHYHVPPTVDEQRGAGPCATQ